MSEASLKLLLLGADRGASAALRGVGHASDTAGRHAGRLGGLLKTAGKAAAIGLAGGLVTGAIAAKKFAQQAIEDQASAEALAKTMRNTAGATREQIDATEEWISKQGVAKGVADDDLRPALQRLTESTHDVGKAQKLTSLAMDVSAGTGRSLKSVSEALMKAHNGNVGALGRLGIATKDAHGKTLTFDQAVGNMAKTFHGQAATKADTLQGKIDRLKLILSETGESIGYKLLPFLTKMATVVLNNVIPAISRAGQWVQANLLPPLRQLAGWIMSNLLPPLRQLASWIGEHVLPIFSRFGSDGPSMLSKLRAAVGPVIEAFRGLVAAVVPVVQQVVATIRANWGPITAWVRQTFVQVRQIVVGVLQVLTAIWSRWGSTVVSVAARVFKAVGGVISGALTIIRGVVKVILSVIKGDWSGAWQGIVTILKGAWKVITSVISLAWDGIKAAVSAGVRGVVNLVKSLPGKIIGAIGNLNRLLWNAGASIIQGLIDGITSKISALTSKLSSITKLIPKHKGPLDKDRRLLTPAGQAIMEGLIHGIQSRQVKLTTALAKVTDLVKKQNDRVRSLVSARDDMAGSFQSMTSSVFGQDFTNPETGATGGISALLGYQQQQLAQAQQVARDMATLTKRGLSKALIAQLAQSGSSGITAMHDLASGTAADIARLNSLDKATRAALASAGMTAGQTYYGDSIAAAKRDRDNAEAVARELRRLFPHGGDLGHVTVEITMDGRTIQRKLLKLKRDNGGRKLGTD